jgi:two-component system NarL family sensor kinase
LDAKYSLNEKQAQIDALNKQREIQQLTLKQRNTMNWALSSLVLVTALTGFLYNRNYRQKKKLLQANTLLQQQRIQELEKERKLLAARGVLQGQVDERTRLAKDLHDGLGSILSSAKYSFANMKETLLITPPTALAFDRSMGMLDQSITELRRIAHNMMPEALVKLGLDSALRDFCHSVDQSGALHLTYQSFEIEESSISSLTAGAVYRIIQELVNNILKHAHATTALVQLVRKGDTLSVTVEDNGRGFLASILETSDGTGYLNLRNRVEYLNGTIDIQTAPDKGTSVNIEISNTAA